MLENVAHFRGARDDFCDSGSPSLQDVADESRHRWVTSGFGEKIDHKSRVHLRLVFTAMGGQEDFERLEECRRRAGTLQQLRELRLMFLSQRSDDSFLAREVAVNKPDADPRRLRNVVHTALVEAALGEANHRSAKDLLPTIGV